MQQNSCQGPCPHLQQQFNVDGEIYTAGGKVNIELEWERNLHALSIGSPMYAPAEAGLGESA